MILKFLNSGNEKKENNKDKLISKANKTGKGGDKEKDYKKKISAYRTAAKLFRLAGLFDSSIDSEKKALDTSIKEKNDFDIAWSYRGISMDMYEKGDIENAIDNSKEAVKHFSMINAFYAIKWCYNDIAMMYENKNDLVSSLKYYRKSNEIEKEHEVEKKIDEIMNRISHPTVIAEPVPEDVIDGSVVDYRLRIRNDTKNDIKNIYITDEKGKTLDTLKNLKIGEEMIFSFKVKARGSFIKPPYDSVVWKTNEGNMLSMDIEKHTVYVDQKISVSVHKKGKLEYGKETFLAISVKNQSTTQIENVKLHISFPENLKLKSLNGYRIPLIKPDEEKSFIFKIVPLDVGSTRVEDAYIDFKNENYETIKIPIENFILEELFENTQMTLKKEPRPLTTREMDKVRKIHEDKKLLYSILTEKKISSSEFIELSKSMKSETYGYTLKGVDTETVYMHVMEECKGLSIVSTHWQETSAVIMLSGQSYEGKTYLLTIALEMRGDVCNVGFRIYSEEDKGLKDILIKLAEMIKYTIIIMSMAKEIEKIEVKEVINIIDSVVQRSKLGSKDINPERANKKIEIKDSVVQRTET